MFMCDILIGMMISRQLYLEFKFICQILDKNTLNTVKNIYYYLGKEYYNIKSVYTCEALNA